MVQPFSKIRVLENGALQCRKTEPRWAVPGFPRGTCIKAIAESSHISSLYYTRGVLQLGPLLLFITRPVLLNACYTCIGGLVYFMICNMYYSGNFTTLSCHQGQGQGIGRNHSLCNSRSYRIIHQSVGDMLDRILGLCGTTPVESLGKCH